MKPGYFVPMTLSAVVFLLSVSCTSTSNLVMRIPGSTPIIHVCDLNAGIGINGEDVVLIGKIISMSNDFFNLQCLQNPQKYIIVKSQESKMKTRKIGDKVRVFGRIDHCDNTTFFIAYDFLYKEQTDDHGLLSQQGGTGLSHGIVGSFHGGGRH